jgi:hypothetical protein
MEAMEMAVGLMSSGMAGEKAKTLSVKLEMDVVESARIVAAYRGKTITEMLSEILRPILAKMEHDEASKRQRQTMKKEKTEGGGEK